MVNHQPQSTTDRNSNVLLDEEDERERVLLVGVGTGLGGVATYAMSVNEVREVIRSRTSTRVPGTPGVMRGLVNVRGMVITVLDLATCLGLNASVSDSGSSALSPATGAGTVTEPRTQTGGSIVLLEHGNRLVGLAVDVVREVRALDDVSVVASPDANQLSHGFVRGLASAGGEVVTLLDVAALISRHLISGES